jgi:hypothetical protein
MRTTIHLPDDLLAQAKRAALESGTTLTAVIEDALRERLARREERSSKPVRVTTFGGSGLQPGVDLDDSAALLDLMERPDVDA